MEKHKKQGGYINITTLMALLLAVFIFGLPFIGYGSSADGDIFGPFPEAGSTETQKPEGEWTTKSPIAVTPKPEGVSTDKPKPVAPVLKDEEIKNIQEKATELSRTALECYKKYGDELTAEIVRQEANIPDDEHFIVTISVRDGDVSGISYFTANYSVRYSKGKYSPLANIADDDFEDSVLFL